MRPVEFAPEAIIKAGQELRDSGRNITGFALRKLVGGGNPTRLKQVWDEHVNSQGAPKAEPTAELPIEVAEEMANVSGALVERLTALAVALNDKAVKAAERRVHEVVRAAGEQREQAERELVDASQTVDDLEAKLDETLALVERLKTELAQSHDKTQQQAVELAQVKERLTLSERTAHAAEVQHASEHKRLTEALDVERQRRQQETDALRTELAKITAKAEAATEQHAAELERAAMNYRDELGRVTTSLDDERGRQQNAIQDLKENLKAAQSQAEAARNDTAASREETAKLRGQIEALQTQVASQLQALATLQGQAGENETGTGTKISKSKNPPK